MQEERMVSNAYLRKAIICFCGYVLITLSISVFKSSDKPDGAAIHVVLLTLVIFGLVFLQNWRLIRKDIKLKQKQEDKIL